MTFPGNNGSMLFAYSSGVVCRSIIHHNNLVAEPRNVGEDFF